VYRSIDELQAPPPLTQMTPCIGRRDFITLLGGAAVAWPAAPRAERAPLPVIGYLSARTAEDSGEVLAEFRRGLAETGFVEGHNVAIEYRWLAGRYDLLPEFVDDLVRGRVSVIAIPSGSSSALAAKAATQTIPIVFNIGSDPVAIGLVASLSHPGQNATGIGMLQTAVAAKRVELLRELVPTAGSIALLVNPANHAFANPEAKQVQEAARVLGLKLLVLNASTPSEIDAAFATMVQQQIGALVVGGEAFYISRTAQFVTLAARHAIPAIYAWLEQAAAGALMCYGAPVANTQRSLGIYTARILKGEKPGDLPVQQVTKLQLIINLTTARALGLEVPPTLLARADEVIE
jgi:putative ABC transport system substrate-binding protein